MAYIEHAHDKVTRVYLDSHSALQRYLTSSINCPETAADIVQEIYIRLPQLQPVPEAEAVVKSWLFRVASNMALDRFRMEKRRSEILQRFFQQFDVDDSVPTPEDIVLQDKQRQHLQHALNALPPRCQHVVYLSRIEGLPHHVIAERLGISISWVEKLLGKALTLLRQSLEEKY